MAGQEASKSDGCRKENAKNKKRYLPQNKPVRKGSHPLRPGVQGFFITCDGGRERQASHEAIDILNRFYEELLLGENASTKQPAAPTKPQNKIIKFAFSDSSDDDADNLDPHAEDLVHESNGETEKTLAKKRRIDTDILEVKNAVPQKDESSLPKKQNLEKNISNCGDVDSNRSEEKSIDKQIEAGLMELRERNMRRFVSLDSGCNGVIFIQMQKRPGDPGPVEIVRHIMTSAATKRKPISRYILRMLPTEIACYTSEEEISKAIQPLILQYFPNEAEIPKKFAVLYEARANTGIERMKIIDLVAKSVPEPHKVDLNNPDKTIIVQVAKTICLVGVVERYKELSKFNLRQLTSPGNC